MSESIQILQSKLQQATSDIEKVDTLFEMAWENLRRYLLEAPALVQQARDLLDTMPPYPLGEIHYQRFLASFDRNNGDWTAALEKIFHVITYYEKHNIQNWLWRSKVLVNVIYIDIGEYALALEVAQEIYDISQQLGDETGILLALDAMGMIYVLIRESDTALDYFTRAMNIAISNNDQYMQCAIYHSLTQVYLDHNQYDQALRAGEQAVEIAAKLDYVVAHAYAHYKLAGVYLDSGDFVAAQQSLQTAVELVGDKHTIHNLRFAIGLAHIRALTGEPEAARDRLLALLHEAEIRGNTRMVINLHEYLISTNEMLGDYPAALHHSQAFHEATTTLFNEKRDSRLRTLEFVYKIRQSQTELEAERQRREQDRLYYENLSKMRDEFITSATHDLKSPLSSMGMMLYMLEDHVRDDPKAREYITRLSRSLDSMRNLITDLLDLASLETLHAVELEGVEMSSFVAKVVEDHKIVAQSKNTALNFLSKTTDVTVCCDQNQMRRVIDNLVSNAIKYTPADGDIFVVLELKSDTFHIHIKDNGYGIPPDDLPHIFERFYRVKNSNHAEETGTGLGLAIAKAIIERHRGTISVESQLNQGTTFSIVIPLKAAAD